MATLTALPFPTRESAPRKRFTRAEYERLIDAGFFSDQRCELIDGDLIEKTGQKPPHALCIAGLNVFLVRIFGDRVRCQLPLEMSLPDANLNLPEPILRSSGKVSRPPTVIRESMTRIVSSKWRTPPWRSTEG